MFSCVVKNVVSVAVAVVLAVLDVVVVMLVVAARALVVMVLVVAADCALPGEGVAPQRAPSSTRECSDALAWRPAAPRA